MRPVAEEVSHTVLALTCSSTPTSFSTVLPALVRLPLPCSAAHSLLRASISVFFAHPSPVPASRLESQGCL